MIGNVNYIFTNTTLIVNQKFVRKNQFSNQSQD